jgi:hypothetical protein
MVGMDGIEQLDWRKGGDSNSYVRRRQFSGLVGYQVAHPFRMERRERVERSNAGFAIQPLTVCCCGAGDQQLVGRERLELSRRSTSF